MNYEKTEKYVKNIQLILLVFLVIIFLLISHFMAKFLVPIFISFFTAMILQPFIAQLNKTKIPSWLSTLIVIVLAIILILILFIIMGTSFVNLLTDMTRKGGGVENFQKILINLINNFAQIEIVRLYVDAQKLQKIVFDLFSNIFSIDNINNYLLKPLGFTVNFIKNFVLFALALIFIIPGMERIKERISRAFPDDKSNNIYRLINKISGQIQNYMLAKTIISLGIGFISFLVCWAFQIEYPFLWGFIIFLFNFIPYLGTIIAIAFPLLISLMQYQSIVHIFFLGLALTVVHFIITYLVEPKFMSRQVNLTPIIIFTSLLVWGYVWGIVGVFISVPLMSAFNLICENIEPLRPLHYLISARPRKAKKI